MAKSAAVFACCAIISQGCTSTSGKQHATPPSGATATTPPKVTRGVRVVVNGPTTVMSRNADVIGIFERVLQAEWDYNAYQISSPDLVHKFNSLITMDASRVLASVATSVPEAAQLQGTVVIAVLDIHRSVTTARVDYCNDESRVASFDPRNLSVPPTTGKPAPPDSRDMALTFTRTADANNVRAQHPRWLVEAVGLDAPPDPRCTQALARVHVPADPESVNTSTGPSSPPT